VPDLAAFDRKAARRLRQGQIEIEARIDLHGLRQHEAHGALRRFLLSCFARGFRWVLVITGKGGPQRPRDDDGWSAPERGVLRKSVPQWLAEPELRSVVVSFTPAAIPHGGEGALYVQLRNPDRARS
jgi:DNA-nicking Smr family endonuclease